MMRLWDTARREVVPFEPGPVVTMYTCGITPYDATHLGHAATYLTYDVLQRRLRDLGHETRCVRNVTDVDDDILRKARELGVHYLDLAAAALALQTLRELRGDLHIHAVATEGLSAVQAVSCHGGGERAKMFGWPEPADDTDAVRAAWDRAVDLTDRMMARHLEVLDDDERVRLADALDASPGG